MHLKIIGAVLIVGCCGGYGMLLAVSHRKEVSLLHRLLRVLDVMISELEYRLTPIPELCRICAKNSSEPLSSVFLMLAERLESQTATDVAGAMELALASDKKLPPVTAEHLRLLGQTLGRFDLHGQLRGLRQCKQACEHKLNELEYNQQQRLRSYQTLGFCAGAALAILLF